MVFKLKFCTNILYCFSAFIFLAKFLNKYLMVTKICISSQWTQKLMSTLWVQLWTLVSRTNSTNSPSLLTARSWITHGRTTSRGFRQNLLHTTATHKPLGHCTLIISYCSEVPSFTLIVVLRKFLRRATTPGNKWRNYLRFKRQTYTHR